MADKLSKIAELTELAGRLAADAPPVAGYLPYNPGPGIYSRLERAVEALPENVRVQELPGLLKRYKDGVPGWELKAVDLDSVIAGRDVVPRQEILAAVKERSPVYTHREALLGGAPPTTFQPEYYVGETPSLAGETVPVYQRSASPIGKGVSHGEPRYEEYGQGGENYSELLIMQPESAGGHFGSHWSQVGQPYSDVRVKSGDHAVAHARYDTHGDALRINELQSDLGIHNRKMRERAGQPQGPPGWDNTATPPGATAELPFPLEDAWADILIKRIALEAARQGHRAIEVASPRAIADKVGGNIDNYEHFYGKVVPGALERLGRKMGGLAEQAPLAAPPQRTPIEGLRDEVLGVARDMSNEVPARARDYFDNLVGALGYGDSSTVNWRAKQVADAVAAAGITDPGVMPRIMHLAHRRRQALDAQMNASDFKAQLPESTPSPGRRYIMSDEMRKRILAEGIPAAIAIGIGTDQVLDRLDREAPARQMR